MRQAPVEERRRHHADVDDVHARRRQRADERVAKRGATRAVVASDRDRAPNATAVQVGGERAADRARRLDRQVDADDAADVVLAEDARRECHVIPNAQRVRQRGPGGGYRPAGADAGAVVGSASADAAGETTGCAAPRCASPATASGKRPSTTMRIADAAITNRVRPPAGSGATAFAGRGFMYITRTTCR